MFTVLSSALMTVSILGGMLLGAGGTTAAQAAESCPLPMFKHPLKDIEKIDQKRLFQEENAKFAHFKETLPDGTAKFDFRTEIEQTTTDKRDISFPLYANGMIFDERIKEYVGSGIMISPCHMLTASHVVDLQNRDETALIGNVVRFDFAKDPKSYHFRNRTKGTIVASSNHDMLDYAIVEFNIQGDSVVYVPQCSVEILKNISEYPSVSVGYPQMHEDLARPAALYGMRVLLFDSGYRLSGRINSSPRDSGGPLLTYTKDGFCVSGIKVRTNSTRIPGGVFRPSLNKGNIIVSIGNILGDLFRRRENLANRIWSAQESGQCNE